MALLGTLLTAMTATAAIPPAESSTKPLQFTSGGHVLGFTPKDVLVATGSHALRVEFVGAQEVTPIAAGPAAPDGEAAPLTRVTYPGIWGGITLAYDAPAGLLRSTYTLAPGADPAQIRLRYNAPVATEPGGGLRIAFATGAMSESAPVAWQDIEGRRVPVSVAFHKSSEREVGFTLGLYDKARPLTIDPTLTWNTFLGGTDYEFGRGIAVDASGNVYVIGSDQWVEGSISSTWGDPIRAHGWFGDAFVAKLDSNGTLLWNTFLGGDSDDGGSCIAVDARGNVYVAGWTFSLFSLAWGDPIRPYAGGYYDAFVAKLDTDGALLWNTFLGGNGDFDSASSISVDASGDIYVAGESDATWGAPVRPFVGGFLDAFVAKLDTNGALLWNSFLGGAAIDGGHGIALDASGVVYLSGYSIAPWGNPISPWVGSYDAFVAKLDTNGALLWNTFFGGTGGDMGAAIAIDAHAGILVTGNSTGTWGAPIRPFVDDTVRSDAFVVKLDADGALLWNTFLGGDAHEQANGIAVDGSGSLYVTGESLHTWGDPLAPWTGSADAFVAKLDTSGGLLWNTFFGGTAWDEGHAIAVDASGAVYIAGNSSATWGAPLRSLAGSADAFVIRIAITTPVASDQTLSTPENTAKAITLSATDADGDPITYIVVTEPVHGTLSGTAPDLIYQPAADFFGLDSFTFKANDGSLDSNIATVSITVGNVAYVLWTRGESGRAALWQIDPSLPAGPSQIKRSVNLYSASGIGAPWQATSYTQVSATEGYVLWTRKDIGKAVLWRIDPSLPAGPNQLKRSVNLYSDSGVGAPWQATSYTHVSATDGYVLWTRSDDGRAALWQIDPSLPAGPGQIKRAVLLYSASGLGAPWLATSYAHVSATDGYVLWTRTDNGRAALWQIDPSLPAGPGQIKRSVNLYSAAGIGAPWQATSYTHVSATEGYVLWTRSDNGRAAVWQIDPSLPTGPSQITRAVNLYSAAGVGAPWQATSYALPGGPTAGAGGD